MYLQSLTIKNIKCFRSITLTFPDRDGDFSGWIVLLGDNGFGKSTLLRAIALSLIDSVAGQRLLQPKGWVRTDSDEGYGEITAEILRGANDGQRGGPRKKPYSVSLAITGSELLELDGLTYDQPQLVIRADAKQKKSLASGPHAATKRIGWFSCGYGPFRRLTGGDGEARLTYSDGAEGRFATLFRESAALERSQDWLIQLYSQSIDKHHPQRAQQEQQFDIVRQVINSLLPGVVRIDRIDTTGVYFQTIGGAIVPVPDLSDGYRSFLALVVDILRHIVQSGMELADFAVSENERTSICVEGIVLIDEVDAHLHPTWQRSIASQLRSIFPKMQFIVTTHSPFVAQLASDNGLVVLKLGEDGAVVASTPLPSVQGWRADQILTSPLFGLNGTRDPETEQLMESHSRLISKREWGRLDSKEQQQLAGIQTQLDRRLSPPGESRQERDQQERMQQYIQKTLKSLDNPS